MSTLFLHRPRRRSIDDPEVQAVIQRNAALTAENEDLRKELRAVVGDEIFELSAPEERLTPDTAFDPYRVRLRAAAQKLATGPVRNQEWTQTVEDCTHVEVTSAQQAKRMHQEHRDCPDCPARLAGRAYLIEHGHMTPPPEF